MNLVEFTDRALDVPFVDKGRSFEGWDCWGLIYVAYREVFDINLLDGSDEYSSTRRRRELQSALARCKGDDWVLANPYEPGDVALVDFLGKSCHVGLMLPDMYMLHVQDDVVAIEQIDRHPWHTDQYDKVEGIYRHVERR